MRQETAALRNFDPAYDRCRSVASKVIRAGRRSMSAAAPKADLMQRARPPGAGGPLTAESVRPRVIRDGTLGAWFRTYSSRAGFHALLNGYSKPSAELVVLVPQTSLQRALFKEGSVPLSHGAPKKSCR